MNPDQQTKDFYKRLTQQLTDDSTWPSTYLYKFILPSDIEKVAEIRSIFKGIGAEIIIKDSSKGTYSSVSIKVLMESPQAVVEKYIEVSSVEGVISL